MRYRYRALEGRDILSRSVGTSANAATAAVAKPPMSSRLCTRHECQSLIQQELLDNDCFGGVTAQSQVNNSASSSVQAVAAGVNGDA